MDTIDTLFVWFTAATIRGSLLVLLVLILQTALRRVISPQWRYVLWLPALFVLIAPQLPQSRWSAENLRASALESWREVVTPAPSSLPFEMPSQAVAGVAAAESPAPLDTTGLPLDEMNAPQSAFLEGRRLGAVVWIIGAMGLLGISLVAYARTWRRMVKDAVLPSRAMQDMLTEATIACGLRKAPRLIVSRAVGSPAVTGLFRPTLLLPAGFPGELSEEEAQLVLRHELIHLKRWDLPVNWLLCFVQAVHWCNPIVWLVVQRIRGDREAACDAQVLELTSCDSRAAYGHALLKMEGTLAPSGWTLGFVGIFEREAGMRTRIQAIAGHRRGRPANSVVAVILLGGLMLVGATKAQENGTKTDLRSRGATPSPTVGTNAAVVTAEHQTAMEKARSNSAAIYKVERKLGAIVIPRLEFREASVRDALAFLEKKSVELDPSGPEETQRGVKIVLKPEPRDGSKPQKNVEPANQDEARITLSLQKIPLAEALRYVTGLANLKYEVTAQGVNVATHFPKSQSFVTKEWVLLPGLGSKLGDDVKAFLVSEGINFPEGTTASLSPDGKRLRLIVTNTQENLALIDTVVEQDGEKEADTPYDEIRRKLETLIIPRVDLREATLAEAVGFLKTKSVDLDIHEQDPAKRGVNIVIKRQSRPPALSGLEAVPAPELHKQQSRLTLSITNLPLEEAIRYVARLSGLSVSVEPSAVALIETVEPNGPLSTKERKLNEAMITALALKDRDVLGNLRAHGITFPRGASAIWLSTSRKLVMRNTQENHDLLDKFLASVASEPARKAEQARAEGLVIPTLTFRGATLRQAVDFIKARSAAADPEKKGVNVVLDVPPALQDTKVTLSLTNASVWDALRQIARIAKVELTGDAKAVRIHAPSSSKGEK